MVRSIAWLGLSAFFAALLLSVVTAYRSSKMHLRSTSTGVHVVLVGASIGQSWQLADWPSRTRTPGFTAESVAAWRFDKTAAIEEILIRPAVKFRPNRSFLKALLQPPRPPDIVILKECSSYFPGDLAVYRDSVRQWVRRLQNRGVRVILATVVPVTRARASQAPGKQELLLAYNQWIRDYAVEQGLSILDLEAALRSETEGSYLREEFAVSDGSHLNQSAYAVLDAALANALRATGPSMRQDTRQGAVTP